MATTNYPGLVGKIQGLREAKAAFQALPQITRDATNVATRTTVSEIARLAKGRILASPSLRTRALYNAIGFSMNEKNGRGRAGVQNVSTTIAQQAGRVGKSTVRVRGIIVAGKGGSALKSKGAKVINPRRYAHLVEFGSRQMPAEPFMIPATASQKAPYLDRCIRAGKKIETDMRHIGSRNL